MQPAPAVSVTCHGRCVWTLGQAAVGALAVAVGLGWVLDRLGAPTGWALAVAAVSALACGWGAWWQGRLGVDRLDWDGTVWRHARGGAESGAGALGVALDFGGWLLLRFEPARSRPRWIAVSRAQAGAAWPALRRAVVAAASRPPGLGAQ